MNISNDLIRFFSSFFMDSEWKKTFAILYMKVRFTRYNTQYE
jgi:hypothetical protein